MKPDEKFHSHGRYLYALARQRALRAILRPLCRWRPLEAPQPGYTIIIGCPASMTKVLYANLALLMRQQRHHLREVVLVLDVPRAHRDAGLERDLTLRFGELSLRFVYYSSLQARVLDRIGWAWTYCWLSWALGVAAVRTRYALLHDLDALLLRGELIEERYRAIRERGGHFLGPRYYRGNGITSDDGLVVTFEMMFDAAWLRGQTRPIDLFNRVSRHRGRRIEYDTFLYPQRLSGRSSVLPIDASAMMHPSQLVCQFVELNQRRRYVPPTRNNLPLLPYFHYLAGEHDILDAHRDSIDHPDGDVVELLGKPMDLSRLSLRHAAWLDEQGRRVEHALVGRTRPEVDRYFHALRRFVERREQCGCVENHTPRSGTARGE
ncbi:MAG: hypothetical protein WD009_01875 [Phycisphaeraceae bacterium]